MSAVVSAFPLLSGDWGPGQPLGLQQESSTDRFVRCLRRCQGNTLDLPGAGGAGVTPLPGSAVLVSVGLQAAGCVISCNPQGLGSTCVWVQGVQPQVPALTSGRELLVGCCHTQLVQSWSFSHSGISELGNLFPPSSKFLKYLKVFL